VKAHALAQLLLAGPDLPVVTKAGYDSDDDVWEVDSAQQTEPGTKWYEAHYTSPTGYAERTDPAIELRGDPT
jgi:hypothetical protein